MPFWKSSKLYPRSAWQIQFLKASICHSCRPSDRIDHCEALHTLTSRILCTEPVDLVALADICLMLVEVKIEDQATLPKTAMQATVECVALALLSGSAREGNFVARCMC